MVAFTDRMTRFATLRGRRSRAIRNAVLVMGRIGPVRRALAKELAGLRPAGREAEPGPGHRAIAPAGSP